MDYLEYLKFHNIDPLAKLIRDRLKWSPKRFGITILIINVVVDFSTALYFRVFVTHTGPPGLFQDPTTMLVSYIMMPVIGGFYIWSINQIGILLKQLHKAKIFTDEVGLSELIQELKQSLISKLPLFASVIISSIVTLLVLGTFLDWYPWPRTISFLNHSDIIPWLKTPMWFVSMYGLCFGLYTIAITIFALRRLFRNQPIKISPWHPDRCGGLKSISLYSMNLGYAIAVIGLTISVHTIQEIYFGTFASSYLTWLALAGYVLLSPLVFFLPLGTAHMSMQQAKTNHLLALSAQFDIQYNQITDALRNEESEISSNVEKIESLQTLYKITEDFTIWPFDVGNLRRFLAITLAPLSPGVLTLIFEVARTFLMD
jgi:hypothetical protein